MTETQTIPIDIHVIAFDETEDWDLEGIASQVGLKDAEDVKRYIKSIEGVYYFNRNERTHCCEVTPSYWLWHLENRAHNTYNDLPQEGLIQDRIDNCIKGEPVEQAGIYVHSHDVERIIKRYEKEGVDFRYAHVGDCGIDLSEVEGDTEEERMVNAMEQVREEFSGNSPL